MEREIGWEKGKTWCRIEGDLEDPARFPIIILHGGPGLPSNYLTPLLGLAGKGRGVVMYDQIGCGNSEGNYDDSLWVMETFVEELSAIVQALGIGRYHLLGHSWGGWLGLEYVLTRQPDGLTSLTLASSCASLPRFAATTKALKAQLPAEVQETIDSHEQAGTTDSDEYFAASMEYATRWLIRSEIPDFLMESVGRDNDHIYQLMQGPEWNVTGRIKDWDVSDRLDEIEVPVLVTSGRHDEMTPTLVKPMVDALPDAEWVVFEDSAHMAFIEETDLYLQTVNDFLERVEKTSS